jgi:hypothetical protein
MDGRRARARAAPVHVTALLLALLGVPVLARAQIVPPAPEAQRAALPPSGTNLYTPPLPALALDPRYNGDTSPTLSPTTCVVTQVTHPRCHNTTPRTHTHTRVLAPGVSPARVGSSSRQPVYIRTGGVRRTSERQSPHNNCAFLPPVRQAQAH